MSENTPKVTAEFFPPGERGKPPPAPIKISPEYIVKPGRKSIDATNAENPDVTTTRQVTPDGIVITRKKEKIAIQPDVVAVVETATAQPPSAPPSPPPKQLVNAAPGLTPFHQHCLRVRPVPPHALLPFVRPVHPQAPYCPPPVIPGGVRRESVVEPSERFSRSVQTDCPLHFKATLESETIESSPDNITGIPFTPIYLPPSMQRQMNNYAVHESTLAPQQTCRIYSPPPVIETAVGEGQRACVTLENEYDIKFPAPPRREPSVRAVGCGSMEEDDFLGNASMVAQTTIILNEGTPGTPGNIIVRRGSSATNLATSPMATITLPPTGRRMTTQQITVPPVGPVQVSPPQITFAPQPQTISHVQQTTSGAQPMATVNITSRIRDLTDQVMRESNRVSRARDRLQRRRRPAPLNRVYSVEDKLYNLMNLETKLANEIANYRHSGRVRDPEFLSTLAETENKLRRLISAENNVARDMRHIKKESFKQETYKVICPRRSITPASSGTSTSMSSYSPSSTSIAMPPMYQMPPMMPMPPPPPMMPQPQMMGGQPMMMRGPCQMMQPGMNMMGGGQQQGSPGPGMYPSLMRISIESPECTCTSFTSSSTVSSGSDSLPKTQVAKEETKVVVDMPKPPPAPATPPPPPPPPAAPPTPPLPMPPEMVEQGERRQKKKKRKKKRKKKHHKDSDDGSGTPDDAGGGKKKRKKKRKKKHKKKQSE